MVVARVREVFDLVREGEDCSGEEEGTGDALHRPLGVLQGRLRQKGCVSTKIYARADHASRMVV